MIFRSVKLSIAHISSLILNAVFDVLNLILHTPAVSDWMYELFYKCRYVKLNFAYSCSLTVDVNHLPCHSACAEQNVVSTSSLRLDVFLLLCHSRCLKLEFVHACNLRMNVFPLTCLSRYVKFYVTNNFFLPCHFACVKLDFDHTCRL